MDYLFRAKDENGNLVYGSVVYGKFIPEYLERMQTTLISLLPTLNIPKDLN